jgi:peptidoglycan/LPS O-acetylase OafA/YrhL
MTHTDASAEPATAALSRHVPALDGMRAICVVGVLMYHAQLGGADAGFLGVSQFFTLSGFLVMSILLRSLERNDLHPVTFWSRRYRRLLPASLLTLLGVVVFGFTLATEQQLDDLVTSIPASLLQVANWHFVATDTSYVQLFQTPSPVQHFWSLAVEEQFYLLIPLLLLGIRTITTSTKIIAAVIAGLTVASTAWMWWLFDGGASIDRVYYGTDTRAAEILVGCVLALVLSARRGTLITRQRQILGGVGTAAYALTIVGFFTLSVSDRVLYRGGFFVYAVLTAVAVFSVVEGSGPLSRLLSIRPLAWFGRLTYAIYLFHWPVMLVLTDDRVGIDGWALFAVQVGLTTVLAALSARLLENPIRYGRAEQGDRRFPAGVVLVGVAIIAGSFALRSVDVETDLAGLDDDPSDAPVPIELDKLRILAIADGGGLPRVSDELAPALDGRDTVLVKTLEFGCGDAVAELRCGDWSAWADAIERHQPDIVLLHVTIWPELTEDAEWVAVTLNQGLDLLTVDGATVVWGREYPRFSEAGEDPFLQAMNNVAAVRPDVRLLTAAADGNELLEEIENYARTANDDADRVLIIGDSVSRTIGYGLEQTTANDDTIIVWSAGIEGCGILHEGFITDSSGREHPGSDVCTNIEETWSSQLEAFQPDRVIVSSTVFDFRKRRLDEWEAPLEPGDAAFDDYLIEQYLDLYDLLDALGAEVTWVEPPCALDIFDVLTEPDGGSSVSPERVAYARTTLLPRLVEERPGIRLFDLYAIMCPDDETLTSADGVDALRPDGVHFGVEGSLWLAANHGDELLMATGR